MSFFRPKNNLYPLIALASAFLILLFGLMTARTVRCSYFLLGVLVWLMIFGCCRSVLKILPAFFVVGGVFSLIACFAAGGSGEAALSMANRFGAVFLALVPGMSVPPVAMTRNLSQLHVPRGITLGMLVTMSFIPVLKAEIGRVREAMKTRGAGSMLSPKIFYRAFLVPLVTRLADISDTLSLSIETRGFTLGKANYTVYHREVVRVSDAVFLLGLTAGAVLTVVL